MKLAQKAEGVPNIRTRSWTVDQSAVSSIKDVNNKTSKISLDNEITMLKNSSEAIQGSPVSRNRSWRQSIFSRVVNPSVAIYKDNLEKRGSVLSLGDEARLLSGETSSKSRGKSFYKSLWRKIIYHQIGAIRLQKQVRQRKSGFQNLTLTRLNYDQMMSCDDFLVRSLWIKLLSNPKKRLGKCDSRKIEEAVKLGIPADLRGRAWKFLLHTHDSVICGIGIEYDYGELLSKFTPFLNEILVDMNRTLPQHAHFAQPFGPGQIALFNVLKAYSCYDPEVGYCQGLSFIVAVILLHLDEEEAFDVFIKLMYHFKLRDQYKDDMQALQIEMYQLSRLLHDNFIDLHDHMEDFNIPAVYAAPWFLTLYASVFPLGFVSRVFDYIFWTGSIEVVFKIALILLGDHKELLKQCDSFESISEFLRTTLPSMSLIQMEKIFNNITNLNISKELLAYEIEYEVLKDERSQRPEQFNDRFQHTDSPLPRCCNDSKLAKGHQKLEKINRILTRQNAELLDKLQETQKKLSSEDHGFKELDLKLKSAYDTINSYKCKLNNLENRVNTLELERTSLLTAFQRIRNHLPPSSNINLDTSDSFLANPNSIELSPDRKSSAKKAATRNGWSRRQSGLRKSSDNDS